MDATQIINDSLLESDEEENEDNQTSKGRPVAKLHILKNEHMPETELPLFLGDNVLGRDGSSCTACLSSPSVSKRHATISISLYRSRGDVDMEALVWDLGSLNGTRKGRLKLTPNVRYALSEHDSLVLADIPCQYVRCSADRVSPQHNFKTSVSLSSEGDSRLIDASNKKESGPDVGSKESDRAPEAKVSSPPLEGTKNTPVRTICLSLEQTPTQPQGTLVPESDVDSDEERGSRAMRRKKTLDSESDLSKSSPTCSSFLSPTNKIVPESEDESPITPPKNRPQRHVSFNKEETNINVGRQQLKEKRASEDEDGRAAPEGKIAAGSSPRMLENLECNVGLKDDELPVSTPAVITDAFQMDSDTDLEGEGEGVTFALPVTLTANQRVEHTSDRAPFYMDSDTDAEDNHDAPHTVPESAPPPEDKTRSVPSVPVFQAEGIPLDSDTDVEDENASDAVSIAKPTPSQSKTAAESAPTTQLEHFHLDSDAESEEEDAKPVQSNSSFKNTETPTTLAETVSAALPRPDSETDDEAVPALATSKSSVTQSGPAADAHADLDILSDSDTDVEPDSPLVKQTFVGTDVSLAHSATLSKAIQSDSDADTDVEEPSTALVLERVTAAGLHVEGEKDVEDEVPVAAPGEGQDPHLVRENPPALLNSFHQYCSTPVQLPEDQVEYMETQAFLSPTSERCVAIPALSTEASAFDSDSQEDDNVFGAETQSFVLQPAACQASPPDGHIRETTQASGPAATEDEISKQSCREESFRLGLSDSSHLQDPLQALVLESTQAFVSVEATQLYAESSHANPTSSRKDSVLEATQAYGEEEEEEPAMCSVVPEREGQGAFSLEPTQAYISDPRHDSEEETDDDEQRAIATEETQPFYVPTSEPLTMAETQPMCAPEEEEEEEVVTFPVSTAVRVKVRPKSETEEGGEASSAVTSQGRPFRGAPSLAETQPMCTSDDRESDQEDSFPGQRKRKAQQLQSEDEQTQPLTSSEQPLVETQPLQSADEDQAPPGSEFFREDNPVAVLRTKPALITSDLPETQLMITGEDDESEESISFSALPRRKAKPLQSSEEDTQRLAVGESSVFETQPMNSGEDGDGVDSVLGTGVTNAKPPQILEEKTQLVTNSESIRETQLVEAEAGSSSSSGGKRGTRARSRNVPAQRHEPSRRRTRGGKDAVRGTSESSGEDEEEEQPKEAGGMKRRQRRNDVDKNEPDISPIKKQGKPRLGEKRNDPGLTQDEGRKEADQREKMEIKEEKERIEADDAQRPQWEKIERERKEEEERAEGSQKEREDKERLEHEKELKERLEGEKHARMSSDRKDQEEKERREHDENLEREGQRPSARQQSGAKELDAVGSSEFGKVTERPSARGRRAARRTAAADSAAPTNDDVPASRTRSRSNSSNSVSSERSASSLQVQESRGRGRGRGASDPPRAVASRRSSRRKTVAALPTQVDSSGVSGGHSSLNQSSQGRGRVSRQPPRGGRAEADSASPAISQSDLKTPTRGRKSNKPESFHERDKAASQQASTARGRCRSRSNGSETAEAEGCSSQGQRCASEGPKKNARARSQKAAESEAEVVPEPPVATNLDGTKELRKGRKRESEANTEGDSGSRSKSFKGEQKEPMPGEAEETAKHQANEVPVQAKRRGRASTAQRKKIPKASDPGAGVEESKERTAEEAAERGPGRPSVAQEKIEEEQLDAEPSVELHARVLEPEVQTPTSGGSRKRQASVDSSPLTKTPRSSSRSPAAGVRARVLSHTYKVLFTCVVDEAGERVLARLGGSMAKGVADMNCLVTDKVRRTVKFLCAVAKGIPVVTTQWLEKSGKAGSFLPPSSFVVKDKEQEEKFTFCLQESLLVASRQPLLQGYQIHVTKSVKPEPVHMKDILACSGATFLPKMPSSHKALTVVISCEDDWHLCAPALSASVPVVTAEFVLTGILQQKLDLQTHALSAPASSLQPAAGRARGRKKT